MRVKVLVFLTVTVAVAAAFWVAPAAHAQGYQDFCLANSSECLNQTNCDVSKGVQLWNINTGGTCSTNWDVQGVGNVDPSDAWPFWCGDGLNSAYSGDQVYQVNYEGYVPVSAGFNGAVTLTSSGGGNPNQGYFVLQTNADGDSMPIDVNTTCTTGKVQHLYAGCAGSGCLVREGLNPASGNLWDFIMGGF
jgi:hypothetical protein